MLKHTRTRPATDCCVCSISSAERERTDHRVPRARAQRRTHAHRTQHCHLWGVSVCVLCVCRADRAGRERRMHTSRAYRNLRKYEYTYFASIFRSITQCACTTTAAVCSCLCVDHLRYFSYHTAVLCYAVLCRAVLCILCVLLLRCCPMGP